MTYARIPPIHCLQAFDALARLRSVTLAGDVLGVTPSAVSHRIRQLEEQLGTLLFHRDFTLTGDGTAYLGRVREALGLLQQAPAHGSTARTRLRVALTPTFSREILLPRLASFRLAYPDIDLVLQLTPPLLNAAGEEADIELRFGTGPFAGRESLKLMSDEVSPVCSPDYRLESGPFDGFDNAADIAHAHLLPSPLEPWQNWFQACGLQQAEPSDGAQFNDLGLMHDAAVAGFGVVLMRLRLGAAWLGSGRLVRLSSRSVPSPHHYFLCWRPGRMDRWECAAFVSWLQQALA